MTREPDRGIRRGVCALFFTVAYYPYYETVVSMKVKYFLAFILLAFASVAFSATNAFDPATAPLPTGTTSYWTYLIAGLSPIVVWFVRLIVPKIPTVLLPTMTPFVGMALGALLNALGNAHLEWVDMAKAGALAVFVREVTNQAIKAATSKAES